MSEEKPVAPAAEASREEILRLLRKRHCDFNAVIAIGESSLVPILLEEALSDTNSTLVRRNARSAVLEAITGNPPFRVAIKKYDFEQIAPALVRALADRRAAVRDFAIAMVGIIASEQLYDWRGAVPGLLRGLKHKSTMEQSAWALGEISRIAGWYPGDCWKEATAVLVKYLKSTDERNWDALINAAKALGHLGHPSGVLALVGYLKHKERDVWGPAAGALDDIASAYPGNAEVVKVIPHLIDALKDGEMTQALVLVAAETEIDLRAVENALKEYVASVRENPAKIQRAKEEASRHYMEICEAVREHAANKHSLQGDGVILESTVKPPSDVKKGTFRAGKTRAIA